MINFQTNNAFPLQFRERVPKFDLPNGVGILQLIFIYLCQRKLFFYIPVFVAHSGPSTSRSCEHVFNVDIYGIIGIFTAQMEIP